MARTESAMTPLGTAAPAFSLPDVVTGKTVSLENVRGQYGVLVMFLCRHCPFVKHLEQGIAELGNTYREKGIGVVAIGSNDAAAYPDDAPESLKEQAQELGFTFPYLYDETQETARAYDAACTPDFFLFDGELKLKYRGQFDDSRPGNSIPVTGRSLRNALDALLAGKPVPEDQKPSLGCNIKWR
jgi:peroxiredoxin